MIFQNYLLESRNIIGPIDSARKGALVRQVPPAEKPTESAAKKRQCERSHWSKERGECAIRVTTAEGWPEVEGKTLRPQCEEQLGNTLAGLYECLRASSLRRHRSRAPRRRAPVRRRHRSEEHCEGTLMAGGSRQGSRGRGLQVR